MTKERLEDTAGPASVPDEQEPEPSGGSPSTRRRFIRAAAACMGAFALFGLVERGSAEAKKDDDEGKGKGKNDKNLRLGKENTAKKQTSLTSDDDTLTLKVENTGDGQALFGRADSAFGVHGVSVSSAGVRAFSAEFKGLLAEGAVIGADGFALEGLGVKGSSPLGQGIAGVSGTPPPPPPGPPAPAKPTAADRRVRRELPHGRHWRRWQGARAWRRRIQQGRDRCQGIHVGFRAERGHR